MEKSKTKKKDTKKVLTASGLNIASGLGGVVVGSALGTWPSLLAGLAATLAGAYYEKPWAMTGGVAMMTSIAPNLKKRGDSVDGFKDEVNEAKDRVFNTLKMLGRKIMLHKVSPEMARNMELSGAEDGILLAGGEMGDFDTSEVDEIIRQLEEGNADQLIEESSYTNGLIEGFDGVDSAEINGLDAISLAATA
ncbi:hypothetical protein C900_02348 [Fulvivirga imtechensis AK7]|uniref:Uncharacterized protein n=1 Tax=Fulvivirga imtechensis AK7 TaxID=1237149 RepID=L8JU51_9BACT|nr:hypothetical protein [Fulvivirga imtechensis]ELR71763.1 hypothetical protein C900_02348 [Fulvivirga imtechensis AK7]